MSNIPATPVGTLKIGKLPHLHPSNTEPAGGPAYDKGYSLGDGELSGRALLGSQSLGYEVVVRLKDTRPMLHDEINFYAGLMARLVDPTGFDLVTSAPTSGKVPLHEHLATILGGFVAQALGLHYQIMFVNPNPRHNRGNAVVKLQEEEDLPFNFVGSRGVRRVLVVDDVVYTRSTLHRCKNAASEADVDVSFLVLYRG